MSNFQINPKYKKMQETKKSDIQKLIMYFTK